MAAGAWLRGRHALTVAGGAGRGHDLDGGGRVEGRRPARGQGGPERVRRRGAGGDGRGDGPGPKRVRRRGPGGGGLGPAPGGGTEGGEDRPPSRQGVRGLT